ncbi:MAG: hypothetical protein IM600_17340 [Bacteroidetes bacterium]|nr:hypothetical protein [Bacteroidota bacterium]MCA6445196.1 hypothetical protein [Bacteroidota bacterium]
MKKTIEFKFENHTAKVSGDEIIIPRIGETICISGLLKSNDERIEYNKSKNNKTLYIIDIFHDISNEEQSIEVILSTELNFRNDFYGTICNCNE